MTAVTKYIRLEVERTTQGAWRCPLCRVHNWQEHWYEEHRQEPHVYCVCGRWFGARGMKRHLKFCKGSP